MPAISAPIVNTTINIIMIKTKIKNLVIVPSISKLCKRFRQKFEYKTIKGNTASPIKIKGYEDNI